jgi:redox-sensitive bicupin YhaK (pirin superfamily)
MLTIRRAAERGHTALGWLDSYHTFSFGGYQDARYSGFRTLRVLNDDRIAPGKGFGAHGHRDMEILSYVLSGALAHRDSTGDGHVLGPNEVQVMSAGSGVIHSEFNASESDEVHFLQIWIDPAVADLPPAYHQIGYDFSDKRGKLRLVAGPKEAADGHALMIHQDARIYAAVVESADRLTCELAPGRSAWVHCATGQITVNDLPLGAGDGVAVTGESVLGVKGAGSGASEFLLFDLA